MSLGTSRPRAGCQARREQPRAQGLPAGERAGGGLPTATLPAPTAKESSAGRGRDEPVQG
jgi:hypothetical protein